MHLVLLHFDIGRDLGSKPLTLIQILGVGFTLGGLENFNGLFGSESVTLLRTRMFESVLFFLYAIIGLLGNIWFNNVSLSMSGQYVVTMFLISSQIWLNLTGKTRGGSFGFVRVCVVSCARFSNGYSLSTLLISLAL